jgi:hypothetical protein
MITGMRIGLGNPLMSIAAAEMLAAQSGMRLLIGSAQSDPDRSGLRRLPGSESARPRYRSYFQNDHAAAIVAISHRLITEIAGQSAKKRTFTLPYGQYPLSK